MVWARLIAMIRYLQSTEAPAAQRQFVAFVLHPIIPRNAAARRSQYGVAVARLTIRSLRFVVYIPHFDSGLLGGQFTGAVRAAFGRKRNVERTHRAGFRHR